MKPYLFIYESCGDGLSFETNSIFCVLNGHKKTTFLPEFPFFASNSRRTVNIAFLNFSTLTCKKRGRCVFQEVHKEKFRQTFFSIGSEPSFKDVLLINVTGWSSAQKSRKYEISFFSLSEFDKNYAFLVSIDFLENH